MNKLKKLLLITLIFSMILVPTLTTSAIEVPVKKITVPITTFPAEGVKVTIRSSPYAYVVVSPPTTYDFVDGKSYSLTFEKTGYFSYTTNITASEHMASICITLAPVTTPAYLMVMTNPSGAQVKLDKYPDDDVRHTYAYKDSTPCTFDNLVVGQDYTIVVSKKGYETETCRITGKLDGAINLYLSALPVLNITSSPSGATVYINGNKQKALTPCKIEGLKRGDWCDIRIEKSGYKIALKTLNIAEGTTPLNFKLVPNPSIYLTTFPSGATVYVDGIKAVNSIPPYDKVTPCTLDGFEANTSHVIRVELNGYAPVTKTVKVPASKIPVNITLQKIKLCTINVKSNPSHAQILINGIPSGITPSSFKNKPFNTLTITVQAQGYISQTKTIVLQNGGTYNWVANLKKAH